MEKTIIIDGEPIRFKMNAAFTYVYKNQFGKDILTVIMPLISEVLSNADEIVQKKKEEINASDIGTLLESVYSLEMIDIQNMIWTMAKLADGSIPEPLIWFSQFDNLSVIDIAVELAPIFLNSLISKKKSGELRSILIEK